MSFKACTYTTHFSCPACQLFLMMSASCRRARPESSGTPSVSLCSWRRGGSSSATTSSTWCRTSSRPRYWPPGLFSTHARHPPVYREREYKWAEGIQGTVGGKCLKMLTLFLINQDYSLSAFRKGGVQLSLDERALLTVYWKELCNMALIVRKTWVFPRKKIIVWLLSKILLPIHV